MKHIEKQKILLLYSSLLILGIVGVCISAILCFIVGSISRDLFSNLFSLNFTFIFVGGMNTRYIKQQKKDPEAARAAYIKENDERNKIIRQKAGSTAFTITIYLLLIALFVSSFMNSTLHNVIFLVVIFQGILYETLNKHYEKRM